MIVKMNLELSVSDATICNMLLESSIMLLESLITLSENIYCAGVNHDDPYIILKWIFFI
jgi:hypothetical protein